MIQHLIMASKPLNDVSVSQSSFHDIISSHYSYLLLSSCVSVTRGNLAENILLAQLMIDSVSDFGYDNLNILMVFLSLMANCASQDTLYFKYKIQK